MKVSIKTATLFVVFLTYLCNCEPAHGQGAPDSGLRKEVRIDGQPLHEALKRVAVNYHTVIGLEEASLPPLRKPLTIRLDRPTLTETMDAVVGADPRYSWQQESSGAVHVFSRSSRTTLLDVVIESLNASNLNRQAILDKIDTSPEVLNWLKQHGCHRLDPIMTIGTAPEDTHTVTLSTSGKSLRENLDQIAEKTGTYYWIVTQSDRQTGCQIGIQVPAQNIPKRPSLPNPQKP